MRRLGAPAQPMQTIKPASKTTVQSEERRDTPNCPAAIGDSFEGPFIVFSPALFNFSPLSHGRTLRLIGKNRDSLNGFI